MVSWQKAKIIRITPASSDIKSIVAEPEIFSDYKAGQHYELRLAGGDISRKYSIVSSPSAREKNLEFGVQLLQDGALSPKLWSLKEGDEIEIRGPLGESFIWEPVNNSPIVLIGAGSGITPLLSIYNSYKNKYPNGECIFIMSAKDSSRIMHYELIKDILVTKFTRAEGRIDLEFLKNKIGELVHNPNTLCYVCGPTSFIDDVVDYLLELGLKEENVRSERFI